MVSLLQIWAWSIRQELLWASEANLHKIRKYKYTKCCLNKSVLTHLLTYQASGTYCHKTITRPPSCVTPQQPTIYADKKIISQICLISKDCDPHLDRMSKNKSCSLPLSIPLHIFQIAVQLSTPSLKS